MNDRSDRTESYLSDLLAKSETKSNLNETRLAEVENKYIAEVRSKEELSHRLRALEVQLEEARVKTSIADKEVKLLSSENAELRASIDELKGAGGGLDTSLLDESLSDEFARLQGENDALKKRLEAKDGETKAVASTASDKIETLKKKLKSENEAKVKFARALKLLSDEVRHFDPNSNATQLPFTTFDMDSLNLNDQESTFDELGVDATTNSISVNNNSNSTSSSSNSNNSNGNGNGNSNSNNNNSNNSNNSSPPDPPDHSSILSISTDLDDSTHNNNNNISYASSGMVEFGERNEGSVLDDTTMRSSTTMTTTRSSSLPPTHPHPSSRPAVPLHPQSQSQSNFSSNSSPNTSRFSISFSTVGTNTEFRPPTHNYNHPNAEQQSKSFNAEEVISLKARNKYLLHINESLSGQKSKLQSNVTEHERNRISSECEIMKLRHELDMLVDEKNAMVAVAADNSNSDNNNNNNNYDEVPSGNSSSIIEALKNSNEKNITENAILRQNKLILEEGKSSVEEENKRLVEKVMNLENTQKASAGVVVTPTPQLSEPSKPKLLTKLKKKCAELQSEVTGLKTKLANWEKMGEVLKNQQLVIAGNYTASEKRFKVAEEGKVKAEGEVKKMRAKLMESRSEMMNRSDEVVFAPSNNNDDNVQIEQLQKQIDTQQQSLSSLTAEKSASIEQLQKQINTQLQSLTSLLAEKSASDQSALELTALLQDSNFKLQKMTSEKSFMEKRIQQSTKSLESELGKEQVLGNELQEALLNLEQKESELKILEEHMKSVRAGGVKNEEEKRRIIEEKNVEIQKLNKSLFILEVEVNDCKCLMVDNNRLNGDIEALRGDFKKVKTTLSTGCNTDPVEEKVVEVEVEVIREVEVSKPTAEMVSTGCSTDPVVDQQPAVSKITMATTSCNTDPVEEKVVEVIREVEVEVIKEVEVIREIEIPTPTKSTNSFGVNASFEIPTLTKFTNSVGVNASFEIPTPTKTTTTKTTHTNAIACAKFSSPVPPPTTPITIIPNTPNNSQLYESFQHIQEERDSAVAELVSARNEFDEERHRATKIVKKSQQAVAEAEYMSAQEIKKLEERLSFVVESVQDLKKSERQPSPSQPPHQSQSQSLQKLEIKFQAEKRSLISKHEADKMSSIRTITNQLQAERDLFARKLHAKLQAEHVSKLSLLNHKHNEEVQKVHLEAQQTKSHAARILATAKSEVERGIREGLERGENAEIVVERIKMEKVKDDEVNSVKNKYRRRIREMKSDWEEEKTNIMSVVQSECDIILRKSMRQSESHRDWLNNSGATTTTSTYVQNNTENENDSVNMNTSRVMSIEETDRFIQTILESCRIKP